MNGKQRAAIAKKEIKMKSPSALLFFAPIQDRHCPRCIRGQLEYRTEIELEGAIIEQSHWHCMQCGYTKEEAPIKAFL